MSVHSCLLACLLACLSILRTLCRTESRNHYSDVTMGSIAFQITSLTIVYSIVYSDAEQRRYQSSASLDLWGEFTGGRWIAQTQDIFSLTDAAWKHPKSPCFCILPPEFEVNNEIHKHENSEVIYSNRNKSPKAMSGNSRLQKYGKHVNRFHLTKYAG